jgi:azurin
MAPKAPYDCAMRKSIWQSLPIIGLGCTALLLSIAGCSRAPQVPPKTIEITADDKMKFSVNAFDVAPGQQVTVTLKNIGTSPKASMGHDFVVLKKNVNMNAFLEAGAMDAAHEYVAPSMEKDIIARTKLLGPGESDTVTFTAPFVPGDYDFICSFPGHATQGMKGIMTVKQ